MAGTLAEEVAKRKVADALNGQDDGDPDPESDTGASADLGQEPSVSDEAATDQEAVPPAAAEKAPRLGKVQTFEDYSVSAREPLGDTGANVPQNVPRGTEVNAQARFLNPATGSYEERVYSPPPEQGDQPYVIDQDTGTKIPRAQLATPEDLAAQPPPKGAVQLPKVDVTAPGEPAPDQLTQVERGQLVKLPPAAPGQLTQVERGELVKVPPGTAPRAVAVQTFDDYGAQRPAQPAAQNVPTAPAVKPAEPVTQPGAKPVPAAEAAPVERAQIPSLADHRVRFQLELQDNPDVARKLMASVQAEVGDQSEAAKQAYIESVMNRATARGKTLDETISDVNYYPYSTISRLGRTPSETDQGSLNSLITRVLGGSNIANFATGNESGDVHSGGAPVRFNPGTGERFVEENADRGWSRGIHPAAEAAQSERKAAGIQTFDDYGAQPSAQAQGQPLAPAMRTLSAEEQTATQARVQAAIQQQDKVLLGLPEQNSPVGLYKRLSSPVEGVSDARRIAYREQVKQQVTKSAQDYYGEKDPDKAFQRATADASFGTVTGEVLSKVIPNFGQADVGIARFLDGLNIDEKRVNQIVDFVHPGATPEARTQFLNWLKADPGPRLNGLMAQMEQDHPGITATMDVGAIKDSLNRVTNPQYQAQRQAAIAEKKAWVERSLRPDPSLQGTRMEAITQQLAALPANLALSLLPRGIRETAFYGELYTAEKDRLRKENPQMSEGDLNTKAGWSAFAQMLGPEAISFLIGGGLGRVAASIENPVARIGIRALANIGVSGAAGGAQVVGGNLISGRPITPGEVGAGVFGGVIQGAPGLIHAFAPPTERPGVEPTRPEERPPVAERPPIEERPPVTEERPPVTEERPPTEQPVTPEQPVEPSPAAPPVTGEQAQAGPVTREDVARRAYEISQEREQTGQPGDHLSDWHQAQQELANADVRPVTQGESEPWVSAIANRFTAERMATGDIGPVEPGQGVTTEEMLARGLKMTPEQINQQVSDLMHGVGDPRLQASAIRAEEARLSQVSHSASLASEANPGDQQARAAADNAFKDLTDFHNGPVAKLKNNWHAQGMTLQGEIPVDLSTFNGLREDFLKNVGKPPPPEMEPVMRQTAKRVRDASLAEAQAMKNLGAEIEKQSARRLLPTADEVRENIMKRMKVEPCPS